MQDVRHYLKDGATNDDAALWRTLTPINLMKAALSCSRTYFTVVPEMQQCLNVKYNTQIDSTSRKSKVDRIRDTPFKEAMRSDIQVLDNTSIATARS